MQTKSTIQGGKKNPFRVRYLVFPKFQFALLGANLGITTVVSILIWVLVSHAFSDLGEMTPAQEPEATLYLMYLQYHASAVRTYLLVAFAASLVVTTVLTLFVSHRFAGPLVRLRGFFRDISEGVVPVPRLTFRTGDYLSELPPIVNRAVERLQERPQAGAAGQPR